MGKIVGYVGGMRRGKTALMVKDLFWKEYVPGRKVKCNLDLTFPPITGYTTITPERFSLLDLIRFTDNEGEWQNLGMGWDEVYMNLEARLSSGSEFNRLASYFVFQSGKDNVDIMWTSQRFGSIDNRLRWATAEVGEIVKALGTFVHCPHYQKTIDADVCRTTNNNRGCPNAPQCQKTQNYYVRYRKWNGSTVKDFIAQHIEQYFGLYKTVQKVSYMETMQIVMYLHERKKMINKKLTAAMKDLDAMKPDESSINDFIADLADASMT